MDNANKSKFIYSDNELQRRKTESDTIATIYFK